MNRETFTDHLCKLAGPPANRAALAHLRRGLSGETRDLIRVFPLVLHLCPHGQSSQQAYIDYSCLFGLHPSTKNERSGGLSLGSAMRLLRPRESSSSDNIESRFVALLQCHREQLLVQLRHCVSLAKSNSLSLKWDDILSALLFWDAPNNGHRSTPQKRWANDFWGEASQPETPKASEQESTAS